MNIDLAVELTELEKLEVTRVDAVTRPANGFPALIMKGIPGPAAKDWAEWDAAHEGGGGKGGKKDDSKADAADAVARAKQTIADHKAGKKVSAADLKNAHDVHEAHLAHLAHEEKLKADAKRKARDSAKSLARAVLAGLPGGVAKAVGASGDVDEAPDVELGNRILALLGQAIEAEAQEMAAGAAGEVCDIMELACAAQAVRCWRDGEQAVSLGDVMPASMLMQSAAESAIKAATLGIISLSDAAEIIKDSREFSADERKKHAAEGNALPDGSYPIPDKDALRRAAILARSGHGDVAAAKKLIARRARELGVANPLDDKGDGASKAEIAQEDTSVDTVAKGSDDLAKVVADAVAKATAPLKEQVDLLSGELAKVKEQPIPGGPVLSRNVQVKQPGSVAREDWAAKAAYYREMAETVTDRPTADGYRKLAREADEKAAAPAAT